MLGRPGLMLMMLNNNLASLFCPSLFEASHYMQELSNQECITLHCELITSRSVDVLQHVLSD